MKAFKTVNEQLEILKNRGLLIDDENKMIRYLSNYNYYRLSGYSLKYRDQDIFKSFIHDEHLYQAFECDHDMRLLLLNLCQRVEAKLKTKIAYELGKMDPLSYLNQSIYDEDKNVYVENENCYKNEAIYNQALQYLEKNNAKIYQHYRDKYEGQYPIWVIIDFMSFGDVVKYFELLKLEYKNRIIMDFSSNVYTVEGFERCITAINCLRNACAHGDRLINKGLSRQIPRDCFDNRQFKYLIDCNNLLKNHSTDIYGYIIALVELLNDEKDNLNAFYNNLVILFKKYYLIKPDDYGLVGEWAKNIKISKSNYDEIKNINHEYK